MKTGTLFATLLDLANGKEKSRNQAAKKFASASDNARRDAILQGLKSKNPKVRRAALAIIGEMRNSELIDEVVKSLNDSHTDVIQMAVWAIGRVKWKAALPHLLRLIKEGYGFKVIKTVVWALGEIGDKSVVPILSNMLEDASARLCEGILVCGIKLGHSSFVQLIQSLNSEDPSVQSALRDASYASGKIRGALIQTISQTKDSEVLKSVLSTLPFVTLHESEYNRLLTDKREPVRLAVYQSISNSALPRASKQLYLVNALSDESNRVVIAALEHLFPYVQNSAEVKRQIEQVSRKHPSPKVKDKAKTILERSQKYQQLSEIIPDWKYFLLETLHGLEHFVEMEAELLGIQFQTGAMGNGWVEIKLKDNDSKLEDLKKLHMVRRVCGVVTVRKDEALTINPYLRGITDVQSFLFEKVNMDDRTFEVITTLSEREMIRPTRKLRSTSLDWRVARAMTLCSNPKTNDVFVDPTCGSGTLLLDRMMIGPYEKLIGGDRDSKAVEIARRNLQGAHHVYLYEWDATSMTIEDNSVTIVAANLPFGRRNGSHEANVHLYPELFKEIMRVLRVGGRAVLLTQEVKLLLDSLKPYKEKLSVELDLAVEMGGLTPHIICIKRTN